MSAEPPDAVRVLCSMLRIFIAGRFEILKVSFDVEEVVEWCDVQQEQCSAKYSTVQYSTVQYSTVQYSTVQYSTVQYSTVQYSTVDSA